METAYLKNLKSLVMMQTISLEMDVRALVNLKKAMSAIQQNAQLNVETELLRGTRSVTMEFKMMKDVVLIAFHLLRDLIVLSLKMGVLLSVVCLRALLMNILFVPYKEKLFTQL